MLAGKVQSHYTKQLLGFLVDVPVNPGHTLDQVKVQIQDQPPSSPLWIEQRYKEHSVAPQQDQKGFCFSRSVLASSAMPGPQVSVVGSFLHLDFLCISRYPSLSDSSDILVTYLISDLHRFTIIWVAHSELSLLPLSPTKLELSLLLSLGTLGLLWCPLECVWTRSSTSLVTSEHGGCISASLIAFIPVDPNCLQGPRRILLCRKCVRSQL